MVVSEEKGHVRARGPLLTICFLLACSRVSEGEKGGGRRRRKGGRMEGRERKRTEERERRRKEMFGSPDAARQRKRGAPAEPTINRAWRVVVWHLLGCMLVQTEKGCVFQLRTDRRTLSISGLRGERSCVGFLETYFISVGF